MPVIIGSARSDERGAISGGVAGDQTGREVCTENYYNSKLGWNLLRAKKPQIAEKIAQDMQWACNNNNIGYDQSNNQSLYYESYSLDFNCARVTTPCETDCSQLVRVCVSYALGKSIPYFYTGDEVEVLMSTGEFDLITDTSYTSTDRFLKRGDILVTKSKGHTVVVLSDGSYYTDVVETDGIWGCETTKYLQTIFGTIADGEIWNQPTRNKKYLKNCSTNSWKFKLFPRVGSPFIKELQKYFHIEVDGWCGINTIKAIQTMIKSEGFYSGNIDGYMGYYSVVGLQQWINKHSKELL